MVGLGPCLAAYFFIWRVPDFGMLLRPANYPHGFALLTLKSPTILCFTLACLGPPKMSPREQHITSYSIWHSQCFFRYVAREAMAMMRKAMISF